MTGSLHQSPPREEEERPPLSPPDEAYQNPMRKDSQDTELLTKDLGAPLGYLLRKEEDLLLPPEAPPISSAPQSPRRGTENQKVNEKESSFDSSIQSPQKGSARASPKREKPFPASPIRSPLREPEKAHSPVQNKETGKSPGQDGDKVVTDLRSFLGESGSPISLPEGSPEKPAMAIPMAGAVKVELGGGRPVRMDSGIVRLAALMRAEVGLRVLEAVVCMVSFSLIAADKTSGWAGDYFDRYQEFRYCFSINVIAFAYVAFQLYVPFHHRMTKRHIISRPSCYYFDFSMDQALAYLLMSASSSVASRNGAWESMFGRDGFTNMMDGSIAASFFAFSAFAVSSVISAYKLFSWNS